MSEDDDTVAGTIRAADSSFRALCHPQDVESTGEVDGQFIIYEGAITKDDDACLGFFSNAFRLPQGQVPFLKILMEDTLADEEDQTVYNDRKRELWPKALVPGSNGEDDALVQYYAKLNDNANPTAAGWLASMLSRWAVKSDYLPRAGKRLCEKTYWCIDGEAHTTCNIAAAYQGDHKSCRFSSIFKSALPLHGMMTLCVCV